MSIPLNEYNLSAEQLKFFQKEGYLVIKPCSVFTIEEIEKLALNFDIEMPDYYSYSGKTISECPDLKDFDLRGCPMEYRILGGSGPVKSIGVINPLHGKRGVKSIQDLKDPYIVEDPKLNKLVSSVLGGGAVVIHNGGFASSYPRDTGTTGQIHTDTSNFSNEYISYQSRKENKYVVNVMFYLTDVSEDLAPLRVIPKTHSYEVFKEINERVRLSLNQTDQNKDYLTQTNWVYDELIPDEYMEKKVKIEGAKGTIILMNSSLLHSATENFSSTNTRKVLILNYGLKNDTQFSRRYKLSACKNFNSKIANKSILAGTFLPSAKLSVAIIRKIKKIFVAYLTKFHKKVLNRILHPGISIDRTKYYIQKNFFKLENGNRNYLNIGSGPYFEHFKFINMDYKIKTIPRVSYHVDLSLKKKFDLEDESIYGIYTSHCLEHLEEENVIFTLKEAYRVLKSGGTIRVTVPDIGEYFKAYKNKNAYYFRWLKEKAISDPTQVWKLDSWLRVIVRSFAGHSCDLFADKDLYRMYKEKSEEDFIKCFTADQIVDEEFKNAHAHMSAWNYEKMAKIFKEIGFREIAKMSQRESRDKYMRNKAKFNNTQPEMSFFIEAIK